MKIQTKTTLLFTLLTATIFLILNITVYYFLSSFAHRDFNKRLELRAKLSAKYRFEQGEISTEAFRNLQRQYLEKLPEEQASFIAVEGGTIRRGEKVPPNLPESVLQEAIDAGGTTVYYQTRFRHFAIFLYTHNSGRFLVIGSATNVVGMEMMRELRILKIIQFVCAVIIIYTVGLYFSRKTFQPFRDIISRVKQISEGNLHLRLTERSGGDEIAELTGTFNQMLNRLETAFEAQNNFISNASHELRTPLTAILGETEFALSKSRTPEVYQNSLEQVAQQAEKLQVLCKGLLSLAQTGFNGKVQSWKLVRMDQLVFDVKADCDAILPDNHIRLVMDDLPLNEEKISINGNYDLLKNAINNIVLNACKYSHNQPVLLQLTLEGQHIIIRVKDQGIGIPSEELKYIYDPFFRASNTTAFEGYGIGMPLANNIIRLHNGRILINTEEGVGTEVRVVLPMCKSLSASEGLA
jgi:signal transduction histidine kinase